MNKQQGFTLIELIAVMVILGILAAVAVPRFIDLSDAARSATVNGIAGALSSAAALNHANNIAFDAGLDTSEEPTPVNSCDDVVALLEGGDLPEGYAVTTTGVGNPQGTVLNTCEVGYDVNGNGSLAGSEDIRANYTIYRVNHPG